MLESLLLHRKVSLIYRMKRRQLRKARSLPVDMVIMDRFWFFLSRVDSRFGSPRQLVILDSNPTFTS
jgi:hypothetical protein